MPLRKGAKSASVVVLEFVKKVHHSFHSLDTLDGFRIAIEESMGKSTPEDINGHEETCRRAWKRYEQQYEWIWNDFIQPCIQTSEAVDSAFSTLEQASPKRDFSKTRQNYQTMKYKALDSYPKLHREVCQAPAGNSRFFADSVEARMDLWVQLDHLSKMAREITGAADNLIFNVIGLMR